MQKTFSRLKQKKGPLKILCRLQKNSVHFLKKKFEKLEANINKNPNIDPLSEMKKKTQTF